MIPGKQLLQQLGLTASDLNKFVKSLQASNPLFVQFAKDGNFVEDRDFDVLDKLVAHIIYVASMRPPIDPREPSRELPKLSQAEIERSQAEAYSMFPLVVLTYPAFYGFGGIQPVVGVRVPTGVDGKDTTIEWIDTAILNRIRSWDGFMPMNSYGVDFAGGLMTWLQLINSFRHTNLVEDAEAVSAAKALLALRIFFTDFHYTNAITGMNLTRQAQLMLDKTDEEFNKAIEQFTHTTGSDEKLAILYRTERRRLQSMMNMRGGYSGFAGSAWGSPPDASILFNAQILNPMANGMGSPWGMYPGMGGGNPFGGNPFGGQFGAPNGGGAPYGVPNYFPQQGGAPFGQSPAPSAYPPGVIPGAPPSGGAPFGGQFGGFGAPQPQQFGGCAFGPQQGFGGNPFGGQCAFQPQMPNPMFCQPGMGMPFGATGAAGFYSPSLGAFGAPAGMPGGFGMQYNPQYPPQNQGFPGTGVRSDALTPPTGSHEAPTVVSTAKPSVAPPPPPAPPTPAKK